VTVQTWAANNPSLGSFRVAEHDRSEMYSLSSPADQPSFPAVSGGAAERGAGLPPLSFVEGRSFLPPREERPPTSPRGLAGKVDPSVTYHRPQLGLREQRGTPRPSRCMAPCSWCPPAARSLDDDSPPQLAAASWPRRGAAAARPRDRVRRHLQSGSINSGSTRLAQDIDFAVLPDDAPIGACADKGFGALSRSQQRTSF